MMIYVKELEKYSKEYIYELGLKEKDINDLIFRNILKKERKKYYFKFVGLLVIDEKVIFVIPKYVKGEKYSESVKELFKLFSVYSKYENLEVDELESFGGETKENNFIALLIYIIKFYLENGLYTNEHKIDQLNGENEINWDKTLNELDAIYVNKQFLYLDFYTVENEEEKNNYFKELNKYIINRCVKILESYGILDSLGFSHIYFEYDEEKFNSNNFAMMEKEIKNELNNQFITSKQDLLKAMLAFIQRDYKTNEKDNIIFYGTRSFHVIWEKVCGFVLDNKFDKLKELIDQPIWETMSGKKHEARTLIPDIVCETNEVFVILDAKYYSIELDENGVSGQPGVEDITKQYLYQLAFKGHMKNKKFKNILLFPQHSGTITSLGKVSIGFLKKENLNDIELVYMPTNLMYKLYCERKQVGIQSLIFDNLNLGE